MEKVTRLFQHSGFGFTFRYPDPWQVQVEGSVITLVDPVNGVGALQFSAYVANNPNALELEAMLREFLQGHHNDFTVELQDGFIHSTVIGDDDRAWQYWIFRAGDVVVFATYNCAASDLGKEQKEIDGIIESAWSGCG